MSALQQRFNYYDATAFEYCLKVTQAPFWATFSRNLSRLGDGIFYVVVGVLLALFEPAHGQDFLVYGLLAFGLELPLYIILKNTIKRQRPCYRFGHLNAHIVPSDKFSLPSGHAAAAFVFAAVVAFYYPSFAVFAYVGAGLIGLSRVFLGVHYPTDIAAGAVLGLTSAAVVL